MKRQGNGISRTFATIGKRFATTRNAYKLRSIWRQGDFAPKRKNSVTKSLTLSMVAVNHQSSVLERSGGGKPAVCISNVTHLLKGV